MLRDELFKEMNDSCLYDDLIPDKLSINEFRELLLQWIESSKP